MLQWDLLAGPFPIVLMVLAVIAGGYLLARRGWRAWWQIVVPAVAVGSIGAALLIDWFVNDVWQAFTDPLPGAVVAWFAVMLAAVALLVVTLVKADWRRRTLAVLATLVIVATSLNGINQYYGYFPTTAEALGQTPGGQIQLPPLESGQPGDPTGPIDSAPTVTSGAPSGPQSQRARLHENLRDWRPTGPMPSAGAVSEVTMPATVSHFAARPGWVYVPPAYLTHPRPSLPLLMLIPGEFGNPNNWIEAGHLATTMDAFAVRHHGLAPIVLMPDANGSLTGNQMCVDSHLGNVDTYLSVDVINWARTHLQVDPNTAHWAVGGFSYGGTCALELAVRHPRLFPTFLDISGQNRPTLGSETRTAELAFGGDLAAYRAWEPLRIMAAGLRRPATADTWRRADGTFVVGRDDVKYGRQRAEVVRGCRRAGMRVHEFDVPGSHSWYVAALALTTATPHLAARMGLG